MTGKELTKQRTAAGLKMYELAELLSVHESTVSKWESETHPIGPSMTKFINLVLDALPKKRAKAS